MIFCSAAALLKLENIWSGANAQSLLQEWCSLFLAVAMLTEASVFLWPLTDCIGGALYNLALCLPCKPPTPCHTNSQSRFSSDILLYRWDRYSVAAGQYRYAIQLCNCECSEATTELQFAVWLWHTGYPIFVMKRNYKSAQHTNLAMLVLLHSAIVSLRAPSRLCAGSIHLRLLLPWDHWYQLSPT